MLYESHMANCTFCVELFSSLHNFSIWLFAEIKTGICEILKLFPRLKPVIQGQMQFYSNEKGK